MRDGQRYPFVAGDSALGEASLQPVLPIQLVYGQNRVNTGGLLDTGAMVNVLPYQQGLALRANWEQQTTPLRLTGNLARYEARVLLLMAIVGTFEPIQLAFAWTQAEDIPLILRQVNFFMEFNVCFYRSQLVFEVGPKDASPS